MKILEIVKSHYFHISFILFSLFGPRDLGLGPKSENNIKKMLTTCGSNVIPQFHNIFAFYSYYFLMFIAFWGSGPRCGPQESDFCHIPGHMTFI
jgi:hypothetical protein